MLERLRIKVRVPKRDFISHKKRAIRRGREFLLTFEEWWKIWHSSGHWDQRGIRRGQYVMARYKDQGPYAVGNVKIITCSENISEAQTGRIKTYSAAARKNMSNAHKGKPLTTRQREGLEKYWASLRGKKRDPRIGRKISAAKKGKVKISLAQRAAISKTLTGRPWSAARRASYERSLLQ